MKKILTALLMSLVLSGCSTGFKFYRYNDALDYVNLNYYQIPSEDWNLSFLIDEQNVGKFAFYSHKEKLEQTSNTYNIKWAVYGIGASEFKDAKERNNNDYKEYRRVMESDKKGSINSDNLPFRYWGNSRIDCSTMKVSFTEGFESMGEKGMLEHPQKDGYITDGLINYRFLPASGAPAEDWAQVSPYYNPPAVIHAFRSAKDIVNEVAKQTCTGN